MDTVPKSFASTLVLACADTVCPPELISNMFPDCATMFVKVKVKLPEGVHLKLLLTKRKMH